MAVALELTRLAVHTPERSASGTRAIALLRRDNGLLVICGSLPWVMHVCWSVPRAADTCINDSSPSESRTNPPL